MNVVSFIHHQRPKWEQLEGLLKKMRSGARLGREELGSLSRLYRAATADFAYASTHFPGHDIVTYLNRLVAEAHGVIYQRRRIRVGDFFEWMFLEVPAIFIRHIGKWVFSVVLFLLFGTVGFLGSEFIEDGEEIFLQFSITDPESARLNARTYIDMTERNIADGNPFGVYSDSEYKSVGASSIMFNNIRVSIFCFVGGILAGVMTFWVLAMNSMMVGAFFHIFYRHGIIFDFWNTTLLHGMIELSMIVMAAMAGFILAKGLLFPGSYTLGDSLKRAALDTVQLIVLVAMWDGIAAIIEGFITGADLHAAVKLAINATTFLMLVFYWFVMGIIGYQRRKRRMAALSASLT